MKNGYWCLSKLGQGGFIILGVIAALLLFRFASETNIHLLPLGAKYNLGDVFVGQQSALSIPFHNPSSQTIEILRWTPSCHCIELVVPQKTISPGQTIDGKLLTSGTRPLGKRAAYVTIVWRYAGEAFERSESIFVVANDISSLVLSNDFIDFGNVLSDEVATKSFRIADGNVGSLTDLKIATDSTAITATAYKDSVGFRVVVQLDLKKQPLGVWKGLLKLTSLHDGQKAGDEVELPLVARVTGSFSAEPPVVQLREIAEEAPTFTVKIHSDRIPIRKAEFLSDAIQSCEIKIIEGGRVAIVTGVVLKLPASGLQVGRLRIKINNNPNEIVQVSYMGHPG